MKKFLIKLAIYTAVVLLIGNLISFGLLYSLRNSEFYKPYMLTSSISRDTNFDYFILGSSRGLTSISSIKIDSVLNTNGINLSMDDTDLKSHVLMLNHFFQSGYKATYCVLTLDETGFTKTSQELGNNDYQFVGFNNTDYVLDHYRTYETGKVRPLSLSRYLPLASLSYYNLELASPSVLAIVKPHFRNKFDSKGNYSYPDNGGLREASSNEIKDLSIKNPLINEVESICERYGSKLIIYVAPYANKSINIKGEHDFEIIDHSNLLPNQPQLFYDDIHVNENGREAASTAFSVEFKRISDSDVD